LEMYDFAITFDLWIAHGLNFSVSDKETPSGRGDGRHAMAGIWFLWLWGSMSTPTA